MANDVRWKSVALKADFVHLDRLPQMPVRVRNVNVTMPGKLKSGSYGPDMSCLEWWFGAGEFSLVPRLAPDWRFGWFVRYWHGRLPGLKGRKHAVRQLFTL
jgi:hypothetical protein